MRPPDLISCASTPWRVPDDRGDLRVAILGAGKMARLHLAVLQRMHGVRVVGLAGRTLAKAEQVGKEFGVEEVFADAATLLRVAAPDAVFVTVSHEATVQACTQVLEAGVHCLVEKPAGYTSEEASKLAALAQLRRVIAQVAVNRRYYAAVQQAHLGVLAHGPVRGVLVEAHEPLLAQRGRRQFSGWLYDRWLMANSIHAIDLLRMVGGEVGQLATLTRAGVEPRGESFSATMELERGGLGTFVAHFNSAGGLGLKIYGQGVTAELRPLEQGFLSYENGRRVKLQPDWADREFKPGLYVQAAAFLQSVCDGEPAPFPASHLADHASTLRLIERIEAPPAAVHAETKCQPDPRPRPVA